MVYTRQSDAVLDDQEEAFLAARIVRSRYSARLPAGPLAGRVVFERGSL
jgi:hypothetical protein